MRIMARRTKISSNSISSVTRCGSVFVLFKDRREQARSMLPYLVSSTNVGTLVSK